MNSAVQMPQTPAPYTPWASIWYSHPAEIQLTTPRPGLNALATSQDVKEAQDAVNAVMQNSVWNMTLRQVFEDAQEAFIGITGDLLGQSERTKLTDILTYGNRLRGLGSIMVLLALGGLLIRWLTGASLQVPQLPKLDVDL